ncbi:hypothetical protein J132_04489, partial [Termitomyces sp. J132]
LNDKFRNVSIITAQNIDKDVINLIGAQCFATETNETLIDFFSDDTLSIPDSSSVSRQKKNKGKTKLSKQVQNALWDQAPLSMSGLVAGKLLLCMGLPIIIKNNVATELCITNGQEGFVYGWIDGTGAAGQCILETLFILLDKPPQTVQLKGLPINVVSITQTNVHMKCRLPTDDIIYISQYQVEVLVNYTITDYSSQEKPDHITPLT